MKILFYPEPLRPHSKVARMLAKKPSVSWHNNPNKPHDVHFFWSYTPRKIKPDNITLNAPNVINRGCYNIGKNKINNIFNDISIDPTTHKGICVEKCDRQGKHRRHNLVECPTTPRKGYVYQRFIENKENGLYTYYRLNYADGIKLIDKRTKKSVFGSGVTKEFVNIRDCFSRDDEDVLIKKCQKFGFNYGDIDFLMEDGVPVIIDVNNMVGGSEKLDNLCLKCKKVYEKTFWDYVYSYSSL